MKSRNMTVYPSRHDFPAVTPLTALVEGSSIHRKRPYMAASRAALLSGAAALSFVAWSGSAQAACTPTLADPEDLNGGAMNVTCTADDTVHFKNGTLTLVDSDIDDGDIDVGLDGNLIIDADTEIDNSNVEATGNDATIINNGAVYSNNNEGIYSINDRLTITNAGSLETFGASNEGIYLTGPGGSDSALVTNTSTGSIVTDGNNAEGIEIYGEDFTIINAGSIYTYGNYSDAIRGFSYALFSDSDIVVTNSGSIDTIGNSSSDGIDVSSIAKYSDSTVTITNTLTGDIDVYSDGIDVNSWARYNSTVGVYNDGSIDSSNSDGIEIDTYTKYGTNTVTVTNTSAFSIDAKYEGIDLRATSKYGNNVITVTNSGDIYSEDSEGIDIESYAWDGTSAVTVSNTSTGNIDSDDEGIQVHSYGKYGSTVDIYNDGDIYGSQWEGIQVESYSFYGDSTVYVSNTSTDSVDSYQTAIDILAKTKYGTADVTVMNSGSLDSSDKYGIDIYARGSDSVVNVTNTSTGDIEADEDGIRVYSRGTGYGDGTGTSTVNVYNEGSIDAYGSGSNGDGIDVYSNGADGSTVLVTNTSSFSIEADGHGIRVNSKAASGTNDVTVTNSGDIYAKYEEGIHVTADGEDNIITVTNTSTGDVVSYFNDGIEVDSYADYTSTVSVFNDGSIDADSEGIDVYSDGDTGSTVVITNTSAFSINADAIGILVDSDADGGISSVTVTNSGDIDAVNNGIRIESDGSVASEITVDNSGNITSAANHGITVDGDSTAGSSTVTIYNRAGADIDAYQHAIKVEGDVETGATMNIYNYSTLTSANNAAIDADIDTVAGPLSMYVLNTGTIIAEDEGIELDSTVAGTGLSSVEVYNSGSIFSASDEGIQIDSDGSDAYVKVTNTGTGSIDATGGEDEGIKIETNADGDGSEGYSDVYVYNYTGGTIYSAQDGIKVDANAYFDSYVLVDNWGAIKTYASGGEGVRIQNDSDTGSATSVIYNQLGASIYTNGPSSEGIEVETKANGAAGDASIWIENHGDIETFGTNSEGIDADAVSENGVASVYVLNSGYIYSEYKEGIKLDSTGDDSQVTVTNTVGGDIYSADEGIEITSNADNGASYVYVYNNGAIRGSSSEGIDIYSYGREGSEAVGYVYYDVIEYENVYYDQYGSYVKVTNTSSTSITSSGTGILVISQVKYDDSGVNVSNSGSIATTGTSAPGIMVVSYSNAGFGDDSYVYVDHTGSIDTTGEPAGFQAQASYGIGVIALAPDESYVTITTGADATIVTDGDGALGIAVLNIADLNGGGSGDAVVRVTNDGDITTYGDAYYLPNIEDDQGALGIGVVNLSYDDNAYSYIYNSGTILTYGVDAYGIGVFQSAGASDDSYVTVKNWGTIDTRDNNAIGIIVDNYGGNPRTYIYNYSALSITTIGDGSHGIVIDSGDVGYVYNSGSITTSGLTAHGVVISTSDVGLFNSGAINAYGSGSSGVVLEGDGDFVLYNTYQGVYNAYGGTIYGNDWGVLGADSQNDFVYNAGYIGGEINTAIFFGSGDDTLGISDTGTFSNNTQDLQDGDDTLVLFGSGIDAYSGLGGYATLNMVDDYEHMRKQGTGTWYWDFDGDYNAALDDVKVLDGMLVVEDGQFLNNTNIYVYGPGTLYLDADTYVYANSHHGITMSGSGATLINWGQIYTDGGGGYDGVHAVGDDMTVLNYGTIDTAGVNAIGIYVNGKYATVLNASPLTIHTVADGAHGIAIYGDDADVDNTGTIWTEGTEAYGIYVFGQDARIVNYGYIQTDGSGSTGIYVNSNELGTYGYGTRAYIANKYGGEINTEGEDAHGIELDGNWDSFNYYYGGSRSTILNFGDIYTYGDDAKGIRVDGSYNTVINHATGYIATDGFQSDAIWLAGDGNTVINYGDIYTDFIGSDGIYSDGDTVIIRNAGEIKTASWFSDGIEVYGDDAYILNTGYIYATQLQSEGINLYGDDGVVRSSGLIETGDLDGDTGLGADGILVDGARNSVYNTGDINTVGNYADGIVSYGNFAYIYNSGDIVIGDVLGYLSDYTESNGAGGIYAYGHYVEVVNAAAGNITTIGDAYLGGSFYFSSGITVVGTYADVTNDGHIETYGDDAFGILVWGDDGTVSNSGTSIITWGDGATGILALGDNEVVTNSGLIQTNGEESSGILIDDDNDGDAEFAVVTNTSTGVIDINGGTSHGIYIYGNDATVTNDGTITIDGMFSVGVLVEGDQSSVTNTDDIIGSQKYNFGVVMVGDNNVVTNSGSIVTDELDSVAVGMYTNASGYSYIYNELTGVISGTGDDSYAIYTTDGDEYVRNEGAIYGRSSLGNGDDEFTFVDYSIEDGVTHANAGKYDLLRAEVNGANNRVQDGDVFGTDFLSFEYFEKTGTGTLTIDGDLFFDPGSFNGGNVPSDIIDGTLHVLGGSFFDIGTATMVIRGPATLAGNGTVEAGLVDVFGTLSPGDSIGTLTIEGNLLLEATSHLDIEINPLLNTADQIIVTGNTNVLGGTVDVTFLNTPQAARNDIIVDGTGTLIDDAPLIAANPFSKFLSITVQEGVGGFIRFDQATIEVVEGLTVNQQATSDYLNALSAADAMSGATLDAFGAIAISPDGSQPALLQELHPEAVAASTAAAFSQAEAVGNSVSARSDRVARSGGAQRAIWIDAIGTISENDGDSATGFVEFETELLGFVAGADFVAGENFGLGLFVSYVDGDVDIDDLTADLDVDGFSFGAYGHFQGENMRVRGNAQYGQLNQDLTRMPGSPAIAPFSAVSEAATSSPDTDFFSVSATAFYTPETSGTWNYEPFLGLAFTTVDRDGDTEAGAPVLGLTYDDETDDSLLFSAGILFSGEYGSEGARTVPHVSLGASLEALDRDRLVVSQLTSVGGAADFTVFGSRPDSVTFDLGAGIQHTMANGFSIGLDYRGRLGSDTLSHYLRLGGQKSF